MHESELKNLTKNAYLIHPLFQSNFAYETEKNGSGTMAVVGLVIDKKKPICALLRRAHIKNGLLDVQYGIFAFKNERHVLKYFLRQDNGLQAAIDAICHQILARSSKERVMPVAIAQTAGDEVLSFAGSGPFTKYSQEALRVGLVYGPPLAHMIKQDFAIYRQQQTVPIAIKSAHFSVN